jgi:hypothetical protein
MGDLFEVRQVAQSKLVGLARQVCWVTCPRYGGKGGLSTATVAQSC